MHEARIMCRSRLVSFQFPRPPPSLETTKLQRSGWHTITLEKMQIYGPQKHFIRKVVMARTAKIKDWPIEKKTLVPLNLLAKAQCKKTSFIDMKWHFSENEVELQSGNEFHGYSSFTGKRGKIPKVYLIGFLGNQSEYAAHQCGNTILGSSFDPEWNPGLHWIGTSDKFRLTDAWVPCLLTWLCGANARTHS